MCHRKQIVEKSGSEVDTSSPRHPNGCRCSGASEDDLARTVVHAKREPASRHQRSIRDPRRPKHPAVALDLGRRPQRLGIIVGKLHRRPPFHGRQLADQADRIEACAVVGIASAKIIGQQRAPSRAEPNAPPRRPLAAIVKIRRAAEVARPCPSPASRQNKHAARESDPHPACRRRSAASREGRVRAS